jgi:hypothetical protein
MFNQLRPLLLVQKSLQFFTKMLESLTEYVEKIFGREKGSLGIVYYREEGSCLFHEEGVKIVDMLVSSRNLTPEMKYIQVSANYWLKH